ncbi:MAG: hypothetical protein Q8M84_03115 [Thiobacillus sp.]|nr:hypothetical protein [Thiobacillus sp.]
MALTTTAAVKAYKPITGTELDALIDALVPRASSAIETYLSRKIESTAHVEIRDGNGGRSLMLSQYPVTAVSAVSVDGQPIPQGSFGVAGWRLANRSLVLEGYSFARGDANVQIEYTAGYATVPPDIEQACIETILLALERRSHIDVSSKSLAGETVSFITADLPPSARKALDPHRRVAPL